ncbi:MAG: iron dicitrate transport regulator FecR, partial [Burkholderiaceae bacterium]|nr:iron dicitrate transport regulator FecR [Burkholderiaceae bacterium]
MTTMHTLEGRKEHELLWFQRRNFVQAAASWTVLGGWQAAHAQQRSNVVSLQGEALINGKPLDRRESVQTGDELQTGPGSSMVFVIGNSSFLVRQNSYMKVERGSSLFVVSALRLITGAVASVWGKGAARQIVTPTLTAGIRGTGVYTEVFAEQDNRSYFCNCYGIVNLESSTSKATSRSDYHQSFWANAQEKDGSFLEPARAINHTDDELEFLAGLV